jgi:hypothetical protein
MTKAIDKYQLRSSPFFKRRLNLLKAHVIENEQKQMFDQILRDRYHKVRRWMLLLTVVITLALNLCLPKLARFFLPYLTHFPPYYNLITIMFSIALLLSWLDNEERLFRSTQSPYLLGKVTPEVFMKGHINAMALSGVGCAIVGVLVYFLEGAVLYSFLSLTLTFGLVGVMGAFLGSFASFFGNAYAVFRKEYWAIEKFFEVYASVILGFGFAVILRILHLQGYIVLRELHYWTLPPLYSVILYATLWARPRLNFPQDEIFLLVFLVVWPIILLVHPIPDSLSGLVHSLYALGTAGSVWVLSLVLDEIMVILQIGGWNAGSRIETELLEIIDKNLWYDNGDLLNAIRARSWWRVEDTLKKLGSDAEITPALELADRIKDEEMRERIVRILKGPNSTGDSETEKEIT